jgi:hypothetical protein
MDRGTSSRLGTGFTTLKRRLQAPGYRLRANRANKLFPSPEADFFGHV